MEFIEKQLINRKQVWMILVCLSPSQRHICSGHSCMPGRCWLKDIRCKPQATDPNSGWTAGSVGGQHSHDCSRVSRHALSFPAGGRTSWHSHSTLIGYVQNLVNLSSGQSQGFEHCSPVLMSSVLNVWSLEPVHGKRIIVLFMCDADLKFAFCPYSAKKLIEADYYNAYIDLHTQVLSKTLSSHVFYLFSVRKTATFFFNVYIYMPFEFIIQFFFFSNLRVQKIYNSIIIPLCIYSLSRESEGLKG